MTQSIKIRYSYLTSINYLVTHNSLLYMFLIAQVYLKADLQSTLLSGFAPQVPPLWHVCRCAHGLWLALSPGRASLRMHRGNAAHAQRQGRFTASPIAIFVQFSHDQGQLTVRKKVHFKVAFCKLPGHQCLGGCQLLNAVGTSSLSTNVSSLLVESRDELLVIRIRARADSLTTCKKAAKTHAHVFLVHFH